jgi:hypothetical protein
MDKERNIHPDLVNTYKLGVTTITSPKNNIIRTINNDISIRKSKHGEYIYYKKEKMKKPIFITLDKFDDDYITCSEERLLEWVHIKLK